MYTCDRHLESDLEYGCQRLAEASTVLAMVFKLWKKYYM